MSTQQQSSYPILRGIQATLTQALARVDEAENGGLWATKLNVAQKRLLAQATLAYGLDPLMQELTVFQGKPLVTIRGRRRKDAEAGHHPSIKFRFLTKDEKVELTEAGAFKDGDLAQYCVLTTEYGNTVEGFGKVTLAERAEKSTRSQDHLKRAHPIVDDNPIEMCQKRAEDRARMMAYGPIPLPTSFSAQVLSEYQMGEMGPTDTTPALPEKPEASYFCVEDNTAFQRHERDGNIWYSHRRPDGSWHNMKEPSQPLPQGEGRDLQQDIDDLFSPDPRAGEEPFDPTTVTIPLPDTIHTRGHFEQVLVDEGWSFARLELQVLNMSLDRYLREGHKLQDAYLAWKKHVANEPK